MKLNLPLEPGLIGIDDANGKPVVIAARNDEQQAEIMAEIAWRVNLHDELMAFVGLVAESPLSDDSLQLCAKHAETFRERVTALHVLQARELHAKAKEGTP